MHLVAHSQKTKEIAKFLLEKQVDKYSKNKNNQTPLDIALLQKNTAIIDFFKNDINTLKLTLDTLLQYHNDTQLLSLWEKIDAFSHLLLSSYIKEFENIEHEYDNVMIATVQKLPITRKNITGFLLSIDCNKNRNKAHYYAFISKLINTSKSYFELSKKLQIAYEDTQIPDIKKLEKELTPLLTINKDCYQFLRLTKLDSDSTKNIIQYILPTYPY